MAKLTPKQIADLESTIIDTSVAIAHFRVLCYGDVGTGKTTWACRSGRKTLVIDCSEGWIVEKDNPNITFMKYDSLEQLTAVAKAIEEGLDGWDYEVVVLDELSAMYQLDLDYVVSTYVSKGGTRDDNVPEQRDYLACQQRVMRAVNAILAAPVNVVILAHERRTKDDKTGVVMMESDFAPRLNKEVNRTLHVTGRLALSKTGEREFQVLPTKGIQAKTRLPVENNTTLSEILALNNKETSNGSI